MHDPAPPLQDRVHYPGGAWEHSHPDRIAANARMFGLCPAPVQRCRVLELGCGAGRNLIPMAYGLPDARFLGVELAARPVALARDLAAGLGLSNVELRQGDILDLPADLGEFDYIVAHGVYSWVPAPVRDALMSVCGRHLAPGGVACLNFDTLPGGHLRSIVRDMMRFRLAGLDEPEAHGEDALRYVRLVADAQPEDAPLRRIIETELDRLEHRPPGVLFHDDLAPDHQAFHFQSVVRHAARHGLRYLCEARSADVHPDRYPARVGAALRRFGGGRIAREQCLDFLVCQMYRCSLFCREGAAFAPPADLDGMDGLRAASPLRPSPAPADLADGIAATFRAPDRAPLRSDDSAAKAALLTLAERWPASVEVGPLHRASRKRARRTGRATPLERREFAAFLAAGHATGSIDLHTWEPRLATGASARPVASALARAELVRGERVTSLRHRAVEIDDPVAAAVLEHLDGTRNRTKLEALVRRALPGAAVSGSRIEAALAGLAYHCLLEG